MISFFFRKIFEFSNVECFDDFKSSFVNLLDFVEKEDLYSKAVSYLSNQKKSHSEGGGKKTQIGCQLRGIVSVY